jgi:NADH:ubiquinone reductase (H+-translocating)
MNQQEQQVRQHRRENRRTKHIVILGSGFAGIEALKRLQKEFQHDDSVKITLVSKDNFLLFTPMLPEVSVGMIETRDIVTPVRVFCTKATFYQSIVRSINLKNKEIIITHSIGNQFSHHQIHNHLLSYDYLVIALGSKTNFFGINELEKRSFTMKTIDDALILRNHIINVLEQASLEEQEYREKINNETNNIQIRDERELINSLLTFVVAGGGFSGIETIGAINDFVRETRTAFYNNINPKDLRILLINADDKILAEVDNELGTFALQKLKERGIEFILDSPVKGASKNYVKLDNDMVIQTYTLVWTAGVTVSDLVRKLECQHAKDGRILVNNHLHIDDYPEVYAVGDCALITDPKTGKPYPPTAQHAIREGKIAAQNIIININSELMNDKKGTTKREKIFSYKTRGMMAEIGKRTGVAKPFSYGSY